MTRTAKRSMYLVFTLFFLLGVTPPQLHAADWTEFKVTRANIQQLNGLKFTGKLEATPLSPEASAASGSASLWIMDRGESFRFAGKLWGNSFDYERPLFIRKGKLRIPHAKGRRLFTVKRNSAGKFQISAEYEVGNRRISNLTVVLTQE